MGTGEVDVSVGGALERFLLAHCPAPLDPKCGCALHAHLENQVRYLPFAPWPGSPGDPLARSGYVHPTRVVIAEGNVRLVRACADRHPGDALLWGAGERIARRTRRRTQARSPAAASTLRSCGSHTQRIVVTAPGSAHRAAGT